MDWREVFDKGIYSTAYPHSEVIPFLCRNTKPGMRVLDVGCGLGNNFLPIVDRDATPVGIDISPLALEGARARYPRAELHQYRFDEPWAALADESIDLAFDSKSLTCAHRAEMEAAFASIRRVLKPGSRFLWWTLSDASDWARVGPMGEDKYIESSTVADVPNVTVFRGYTFLSFPEATRLAEAAGFTITSSVIVKRDYLNEQATRRVYEYFVFEMVRR